MIFKPIKFKKLEVHIWTILLFAVGLIFDFFEVLVIAYGITALHETAHILTAKRCGVKTEAVEVMPFGITMRVSKECIANTTDEIKISVAGPLSNFLIVYLVYGFYGGAYKEYIIITSLAMGIFNLLPALPLDGGRIMRAILVKKAGHIRATTIALKITKITSAFVVLSGLYILFRSGFNFSFLLIGGFLIANLTEERKNANMIIMKDILFSRKKLSEKGTARAEILAADLNESAKKMLGKLSYDKYYLVNVVDSRMEVIKTLTETEVIENMAVYGMNITFKKIVGI